MASYIYQIQLISDEAGLSTGSAEAGALPELVISEGLQECKNSLAATRTKLEEHMRDFMDQLLVKSKTTTSSDEDA